MNVAAIDMHVGHINLARNFDDNNGHFVFLIESLQRLGIKQYVVVRNIDLARRLDVVRDVTVGPTVRSPITAHCLIPAVDIVHVHDRSAWQAGLLLILTKSIPFVLTASEQHVRSKNPIVQSIVDRAAELIPEDIDDANDIVPIYKRAVESLRVPTMLL